MLWGMESNDSVATPSFAARLGMAFRLLFKGDFARRVQAGLNLLEKMAARAKTAEASPPKAAPERVHASGLFVLSVLQREGRLIDFLQQDVTGFSDEDVGAAARVVHAGCSRALKQYLDLAPAIATAEGSGMTVPDGFDVQRIRLTGNVTGQPPFKGTVKHHGWVAKEIRLPDISESLDPRVVAPAEVEL
jgi:Domain of unknown function (DUF2760)